MPANNNITNADPSSAETKKSPSKNAKGIAAKVTDYAGWVASCITIVCAIVLALDGHAPMRWLFVGWSVSNTLWVFYGWRINSMSLLSSQLVFCLIDVVGMYHYWIL